MTTQASFKRSLVRSGIYTGLLCLLFVYFTWNDNSLSDNLLALPYFAMLYFILLSIGKPRVSDWVREKMKGDIRRIFLFPVLLVLLYFSYIAFNGENPLKGTIFLIPYLLFFPVLLFAANGNKTQKTDWLDFTTFVLYFFPVTLLEAGPSDLPFNGGGFDSVYRISVMLSAVFAFVTVRHIRDVGFYPVFKWRYLFTTLWVWLAFYAFAFVIGYALRFITLSEEHSIDLLSVEKIIKRTLGIFLHTALFEELVFRGLLQNMLKKRIEQPGASKIFRRWGLVILVALSLLTGYSLKGNMQWFPALVTILLFGAAFGIEKTAKSGHGTYTALAITSVIFGLVHWHAGSIIFVGLASIGGWAYGYVYLKTGNVFYAALLHALVNATPLLFGLDLAK